MNEKDKGTISTHAFICNEFADTVIKEIARIQEVLGNKIFIGKLTDLENKNTMKIR